MNNLNEEDKYKKMYLDLLEERTLSTLVGDTVIKSRKSLKSFLKMPFDIIKLYKCYKDGKFRQKISYKGALPSSDMKVDNSDNTILFMATNGVGLGHLTRCLAVARKLKKKMNADKIIFLTTSFALHLVRQEGFLPFYVPSKEMFEGKIKSSEWDYTLGSTFEMLFSLYDIKTVVFDGAIPYQSLSSVLDSKEGVLKIWIKRGSAKKSENDKRKAYESIFDKIIIPSELSEQKEDDENHKKVSPIVYLDKEELLEKDDVKKFFGVSKETRLVYVQLGAGKINDTADVLENTFKILSEYDDIVTVYGNSPLAAPIDIADEKIRVLKDYPNARFFKGFDFAISACGYNSFHELMGACVPTIFIPNMNTKTDDQYLRAKISEKYNCGRVLKETDYDSLKKCIDIFAKKDSYREFIEKIIQTPSCTGSSEAADYILKCRQTYIKGESDE